MTAEGCRNRQNQKISVIMPVYNSGKSLRSSVDSICRQSFENLEIILVDDGSTDQTGALCDELGREDSRIVVLHKENAGAGFARNTGLAAATGTYIAFADADDRMDERMLEKLYQTAEETGAELVLSGARIVGGSVFGKPGLTEEQVYFEQTEVFEGAAGIRKLALGIAGALPQEERDTRYGHAVWRGLYQGELIRKNKLQFVSEREYVSEDLLFLLDFIRKSQKAVGIPDCLYSHCREENSVSRRRWKERFPSCKKLAGMVRQKLDGLAPPEEIRLCSSRLLESYARVCISQEFLYGSAHPEELGSVRETIQRILRDEELQQILKTYPWQKLPFRQAVFAFGMKHRMTGFLRLLVVCKNKAGK